MNITKYLTILLFLFISGSVTGWGIEVLFRRFISTANPERRWINPGFLMGPYVPLYGWGLVVLYAMASIPIPIENETLRKLVLFALMAVCMTLIEFLTGMWFLKKQHVRLWDYTARPGNIKGVICPLFSFFWAIIGAFYYFILHPRVLNALNWLADNMAFCLVIGFFYGIFAVDVVYSFRLVARIRQFAAENDIIVRYEMLKSNIRAGLEEKKEKWHFLMPFRSEVPIREHLERYLQLMAAFYEDKIGEKLNRRR
ncbi:MAG: putative ABC transporter permease [Lachnospiraceae bacterium]|nr:putative ABC transporter permease [Lachnospiraceae bacterium]